MLPLAETFLLKLIAGMGITPDQVHLAMSVVEKLSAFADEAEGFKRGTGAMVAYFSARLDAQDERLARIETMLADLSHALRCPPFSGGIIKSPILSGELSNGRD
jgi:hypothetical protein